MGESILIVQTNNCYPEYVKNALIHEKRQKTQWIKENGQKT